MFNRPPKLVKVKSSRTNAYFLIRTNKKVCVFPVTCFLKLGLVRPREHEGTERDTEGVGCDMS